MKKNTIIAIIAVIMILMPLIVMSAEVDGIRCLTEERDQLLTEVRLRVHEVSAPKEWKQVVLKKIERIRDLNRQLNRQYYVELSATVSKKACLLPPVEKISSKDRFIVLSPNEVFDTWYGLTWQTCRRQVAMTLSEAEKYSADRGYRLPTLAELRSLVDEGQINPALPEDHPFCQMGGEMLDYWTSNKWLASDFYRMTINFWNGHISYRKADQIAMVWGVK